MSVEDSKASLDDELGTETTGTQTNRKTTDCPTDLQRMPLDFVRDDEEQDKVSVGEQVQVALSLVQGQVEENDCDAPVGEIRIRTATVRG